MLVFEYLRKSMSSTRTNFRSQIERLGVLAVVVFGLSINMCLAQGMEATDDPVAIFNQAQEIHEKGDLPGAILLYEKALKIMPEFPEAEFQHATALLSLGKTGDAELGFRRAVALRTDWTLALASLGSVLVQRAKYGEAEPILTKAIELDGQNFPALLAMTELRLKTNATAAVLNELLSKIMGLSTKASPPASVWAARAALERAVNLGTDARTSIDKALALDPKNKFAIAQSADIALFDGDSDRAAADAGLLERISPGSEAALLIRARILAHDGKLDDAAKLLDANATPSPEAIDLRAKLTAGASKTTVELEKQLQTDPKNPAILGSLCTQYRKDDPAKALDFCRRAADAEPSNINHAIGFAAALVQGKQFDQAVVILLKIIKIVPENWTAHANLATALFQLKRYAEAKTEFEWLTVRQPKSPAAYYFLAIAHDQLEEYLDAMANYQQYMRLADPAQNKLDLEKVNLRLPLLQKLIKDGKGKKNQ